MAKERRGRKSDSEGGIGMKKKGVSKGLNEGQRFEVLLEEVRHNLKSVAEGHSMLASKLEEHDEKLDEMNTMIRKIDANYFKLQMDTESIKSQTGTIDIKLDRIERELGATKKEHERRITKLEEKVFV